MASNDIPLSCMASQGCVCLLERAVEWLVVLLLYTSNSLNEV